MNVAQCRMARAGLRWSLDDLAKASGISRASVARFESGASVQPETIEALRAALVREGVAFINGGKRLGVEVPRRD